MIGIVGCGVIGSSWAAIFLTAGHRVLAWDSAMSEEEIRAAVSRIFRDGGFDPKRMDNLVVARSPEEFATGIDYIQESIVESIDAKRKLFAMLDRICERATILASSSSALSASRIAEDLEGRERVIVCHPATPPHAMPAVEIVPAPFTSEAVFKRAWQLLQHIGQVPIHVLREVEGFAMNRMQAALLFSMLEMIEEGIVTPEGADAIIRESFGMRWAILGPLEAVHLNAPGGIRDYFTRYRPLFAALCGQGQSIDDLLSDRALDRLAEYAQARTPTLAIPDRRSWRDSRLVELKRWKSEEGATKYEPACRAP